MSDAKYQSAQSSRALKLIGIAADTNKLLASKSKIAGLNIGTQPRPRGLGTNKKLRGTFAAKRQWSWDGAMMTRTAPSRSPLFFIYFARRNRRERHEYYFIVIERGQHLPRADRVAQRLRAVFR